MTHLAALAVERNPHRFTLLLLARTRKDEDAIRVAAAIMATIPVQAHRETFLRQVTNVVFNHAR